MRIICKTQRTAEWFAGRVGRCTASRAGDFTAKLSRASKNGSKGDWSAAHWNYVSELAWEKITGVPTEHYVSKPMEIGQEYEGESKVEYWQRYGTETDDIGLVLHPRYDFLAASPDSLVGADGLAEFKVPTFKVHCSYLEADEIPEEYQLQMQCQLLCCERDWADFVSYCPPDIAPELPDEFRMFRKRLYADPAKFLEIEEAATVTMEHVVQKVKELRERYPEIERKPVTVPEQQWPADLTSDAYDFVDQINMTP